MAITSNIDLVNTYDSNNLIQSTAALGNIGGAKEHAAQCIAIEIVRQLIAMGLTTEQYNEMTPTEFEAVCAIAKDRAALNVNAPIASLSQQEHLAACNLGGNFFEHGYVDLMANISPQDKISFTRIGGL